MKWHSATICILLCAAVSACAGIRPAPPATHASAASSSSSAFLANVPASAGDMERILAYYDYVARLPAVELTREFEQIKQDFNKSRSEFSRVQLALLLSLPNTGFSDEGRALSVLEPLVKDKNAPASVLKSFAQLLYALDWAARDEQKHGEDLQQKLDALKEMEKNMTERQQTASPTKK